MRQISLAVFIIAGCAAAAHAATSKAASAPTPPHYNVSNLDSLGGKNARGTSINDIGMVSGYSTLAEEKVRHGALWAFGRKFDLGTLGNPATSNSAVLWPVKNVIGVISGISQTDTPDPNQEKWSCGFFFSGPYATGNTCRGFVWEFGSMRALPTLGGNNGFATGTNNWRQTVGWAENAVFDSACVLPQKLQFRPVVWGPGRDQIRELPLLGDDTSGSATAINDRGQVIGISGICDQAFGRSTAKHAVLWEHGHVTDLGSFGADYWNTPVSISQRGDVVGFAGEPGDSAGAVTHAFIWTREHGMQRLDPDADDNSVAYGINERRQVVGQQCDASGCHAFLWQNGVMTNLNDLKQADYTDTLFLALDINDFGQITGRANGAAGVRSAFLAKPVGGSH